MTDDLHEALRSHFGFDRFLPGQEQVVGHLLAGKSAAAVFPTGGGKSLCYQLPALVLPGLTLVVSPLIALMKDQIDALSRRGIAAARLDSTLSADEYAETMRRARTGAMRLLYVAPERFQNERFRQAIGQARVSLFAVDEAHCISEWGHNFRPDYLKLVEFARQCRAERLLALTATATPQVLEDVCRAFDIEPECVVRNSCYRPNLTLLTTPVSSSDHESQLLRRLRDQPAGPTIIYVTLQRTAEELAARIVHEGFAARAYHAGLDDDVPRGHAGLVHALDHRDRRRDHRLRNGDRQGRHSLRLSLQSAQEPGKLRTGNRSRWTRRGSCRLRNAALCRRSECAREFRLWRYADPCLR